MEICSNIELCHRQMRKVKTIAYRMIIEIVMKASRETRIAKKNHYGKKE